MSPNAPAPRANGALSVVPIRPAVPLKWEKPSQAADKSPNSRVIPAEVNNEAIAQLQKGMPKETTDRVRVPSNSKSVVSSLPKEYNEAMTRAQVTRLETGTTSKTRGRSSKESSEESKQTILTPQSDSSATLQGDTSSHRGEFALICALCHRTELCLRTYQHVVRADR